MTPEFANHRLASVTFLRGPDLPLFHHMVMEILRMKHDGENLPIPDEAEAGAWTKAYSLYERLKDRTALEEYRAVQRNQWFAEDQKAWNTFIEDREIILDGLRRDVFDEHTLEHLGLQKDDLGDVLVKERNRDGEYRHPEWSNGLTGSHRRFAGGMR